MSFQSFNLHSQLLQVLKKNLFSVFLAADDRDESEISFGERGPWKRGAGRGFTAELTLLHGSGSDRSSMTQQDGSCLTNGNFENSTGIWQWLGAKQHASEEGEGKFQCQPAPLRGCCFQEDSTTRSSSPSNLR